MVKFKGESPRDPKEGIENSIRPNRDNAMHPYLRDVFPLGTWENTSFKWKLDSRATSRPTTRTLSRSSRAT